MSSFEAGLITRASVAADGRRQVLGLQVGHTESETVLTRFLPRSQSLGPHRSAASDQRRVRGLDPHDPGSIPEDSMAAVSRAFHEQRPHSGSENRRANGRREHPHDPPAAWEARVRACPIQVSRHVARPPSRRPTHREGGAVSPRTPGCHHSISSPIWPHRRGRRSVDFLRLFR